MTWELIILFPLNVHLVPCDAHWSRAQNLGHDLNSWAESQMKLHPCQDRQSSKEPKWLWTQHAQGQGIKSQEVFQEHLQGQQLVCWAEDVGVDGGAVKRHWLKSVTKSRAR